MFLITYILRNPGNFCKWKIIFGNYIWVVGLHFLLGCHSFQGINYINLCNQWRAKTLVFCLSYKEKNEFYLSTLCREESIRYGLQFLSERRAFTMFEALAWRQCTRRRRLYLNSLPQKPTQVAPTLTFKWKKAKWWHLHLKCEETLGEVSASSSRHGGH